MQGIYIDGHRRPKSKKEVKELIREAPERVSLEQTSIFPGTEFDGPLNQAPVGTYECVGPDPRYSRKFYLTIIVKDGGFVVK